MDFGQISAMIEEYAEDAAEIIERFEAQLLSLEQGLGAPPDRTVIAGILSGLHTLKGNSGMMGYSSLAAYVHALEDIFKAVQSENIALQANLLDTLLERARDLKNAIASLSVENPAGPDLNAETNDLKDAIEALTQSDERDAASALETPQPAAQDSRSAALFERTSNILRVDFKRLDHLLNLLGELVIQQTRLEGLCPQFRDTLGDIPLCADLDETSEQIRKITSELHQVAMGVRMLPIRQVFKRFPRYGRDLSKKMGKEIDISIKGESTELDKTVLDEIGEPLMHLLRNAIDHGIETPEERTAARKPRQGKIVIEAKHESSHVLVIIEDDGRGIRKHDIEKRAAQAGLSIEGEKSYKDLIFLPGLSTAKTVTEVSGRGIGMDVVKSSLTRINGSIDVDSKPGKGTRFTIKLPLTLAIISALIVEVSNERYAIPLSAVQASFKIKREDIHLVNQREVVRLREEVLPLRRLSELYGTPVQDSRQEYFVVAVSSSFGQLGLVVDALLGQQQIVIKPLDDFVGDSTGIAGTTILGDGRVVLIVDVNQATTAGREVQQQSIEAKLT